MAIGADWQGGDDSGAVYVFRRSGAVWTQEASIKASNPALQDYLGVWLTLSGDGSTLVVGANQYDTARTGSGAVYVFRRNGTTWARGGLPPQGLEPGGGRRFRFSRSGSLSADGSTLAVGALGEDSAATGIDGSQTSNAAADSGAVYLFRWTGTTWAQDAYVKASNTGPGDQFGYALALSADGTTLAVGAYGEDSAAVGVGGDQADNSVARSGATYVFRRAGSTWAQEAYLKGSLAQEYQSFGYSVALSADGASLCYRSAR